MDKIRNIIDIMLEVMLGAYLVYSVVTTHKTLKSLEDDEYDE